MSLFSRTASENASWLNSLTPKQNVLEQNVMHLGTLTPEQREIQELRAENARLREKVEDAETIQTIKDLLENMGLSVSTLVSNGKVSKTQMTEVQRMLRLIESKQTLTAAELHDLKVSTATVLRIVSQTDANVEGMQQNVALIPGIREDVSAATATLAELNLTMKRMQEDTKGIVSMVQYLMDLSLKTNALIQKIDEIHGKKLDAVQAEIVRVRKFLEVSCVVSGKNLTQIIYEILQCIYQFMCFCFSILKYISILVLEMQAFFASSLSDKLPERYRARGEVVIFTLLSAVQLYFLSILGNMFGSIFGFEKIGTAAMTKLIRTIFNCISYLKELFVSFITDPRISSSVKALATLFYIKLGIIYDFVYTTGRNYLVATPDITVMGGGPGDTDSTDESVTYVQGDLLSNDHARLLLENVVDSIQRSLTECLDIIKTISPENINEDSLPISNISISELKQIGFRMEEFKSVVTGKRSGGVRLRTKKYKSVRMKKKVRKTRK